MDTPVLGNKEKQEYAIYAKLDPENVVGEANTDSINKFICVVCI